MEYPLKLWVGVAWIDRTLSIQENGYTIKKLKNNLLKKSNCLFYNLENGLITNVSTPLEFCVQTLGEKNLFKVENEEDKITIVQNLQKVIKKISSKNSFSNEYEQYKEKIIDQNSTEDKTTFENLSVKIFLFQNLFLEMNDKLYFFDNLIKSSKLKKFQEEFVWIMNSVTCIKEEMKKMFDELVDAVYLYHDEKEPENAFKKDAFYSNNKKKKESLIKKNETINLNNIIIDSNNKHHHCNHQLNSSSDAQVNTGNNNENSDKKEETSIKDIEKCVIEYSNEIDNYKSSLYNNHKRLALAYDIQCSKDMRSALVKSINTKKIVLPIYFNEPISMLQKQCEKFYYCDYLNKAAEETLPEKQLCFISAFIIGEMSLNINRILKPFNPILGETFEYFDNEKGFRYLAEQVSHHPPVSAFIGESQSFALFSDTRGTTSFKLLKGAVELEFGSKIHLILKKTKDYYIYNRPLLLMKGMVMPPLKNDYSGTITIINANDPRIKATINFIEETRKIEIGGFEGKITKNDEVIYLIGGNWLTNFYYSDAEGNNKVTLLSIEDEEFIHNNPSNYKMPKYTCDFNLLTSELENSLPKGDSRFRPDMKAYEEGRINEAQELRKKVEGKQSLKHEKFEKDKIEYEPMYFKNRSMTISGDSVYCYIGGYWEDRKNKSFKENDIFQLDGSVFD